MLNDRELEIADLLLKHMRNKNGKFNTNNTEKYLSEKGFDVREIRLVMSYLIKHYKLIEYYSVDLYGNTEFHIRITPEGNKAIKLGIAKYIKKKEKNYNKIAITISIFALSLSAIDPGIQLMNTVFPKSEIEKKDYNVNYRNYYTDSIIKQVLTNEAFVEQLKVTLIHDSIFLNILNQKTIDKLTPAPNMH